VDQLVPGGQAQRFGHAVGLAEQGHVGQDKMGEMGVAQCGEALDKFAQQSENQSRDGQADKPWEWIVRSSSQVLSLDRLVRFKTLSGP
jgi:hypothetical protein